MNQHRRIKLAIVITSFQLLTMGCDDLGKKKSPIATTNTIPSQYGDIVKLIQNQKHGAARIRLKQSMQKQSNDPFSYFLYGLTRHREKLYSEASIWFEKSIAQSPQYIPTYHFLGWSLYYTGKANEAKKAFKQHIKLHKQEADDYFAIGLILLEEGYPKKSIQYFDDALNLLKGSPTRKKDYAKTMIRKGEALTLLQKTNEAISLYKSALNLIPDQLEAYYKLSRLYLFIGDKINSRKMHAKYLVQLKKEHPSTSFPE